MTVDVADLSLGRQLVLRGANGDTADLVAACTSAVARRSISEASYVEVHVRDAGKELWRSKLLKSTSWLDLDGMRFRLDQFNRPGGSEAMVLTFRDEVAVRMSKRKGHIKVAAGTTYRSSFIARLAREARVPYDVEPGRAAGKTKNPLERATEDDPLSESSWEATGRLADEVRNRRFSDGRALVYGSDEWLTSRIAPVRLREGAGGVVRVGCDFSLTEFNSAATLDVTMERWAAAPGTPVELFDEGPASGLWLIDTVERSLTSLYGTVSLTRRTKPLAEPKASDSGDDGDDPALPGEGATDSGGKGHSAAAERAIAAGKALVGKPYVYGGKGPDVFDCSGFVSWCIRAGGGTITGTAAGLLAACQARNATLTVADALRTRGALLFNIGGGSGASGNHIAFSLGNGQTLEARSRADDIGIFGGAASRGWTHGARVPGF